MVDIGINFASEVHGPTDIVEYAARADEAGFDFAVVSDHFHPWLSKQGHSPFVWNVIGGIAGATENLEIGTSVTCPLIRIHPAIVAQAAATSQVMADGRFFLGVGTGENLNEHVLGDRWPPHDVRLSMLDEAVAVMRELWTGENVTHRGEHYTVENAKLFTSPEDPPPVHVSGLGPKTATAAGDIGDGFIATEPDDALVQNFSDGGGDGPKYGGARVSYADTEEEGYETAFEWWPNTALKGVGQELPTPAHFEQAVEMVSQEDITDSVVAGPDPEPYVERVEEYVDAGFDRVYLHQTGPRQEAFIDYAAEEILPEFE